MTSKSDQNLLFGIIALQMDFVRREQLVAATSTWLVDKSRELGDILTEQGALSEADHKLLAPLVSRHVENHGGDPQQSLTSLSSIGSVADDLRSLGDADVEATMSIVPANSSLHEQGADGQTLESSNTGIQRFSMLRPHAKGGLGMVSVAHDNEVHREVALKEILPQYANDEQSRARFLLEAEITGGLEHPGVVPVYGLGQYDDGRPFYAMRFIKGASLKEASERLHSETAVDFNSVEFRKLVGRFIDVCEAIQYAHSRGVLHRDLKPGNIMLGKYGETLVVDWGLAKVKGRGDLVAYEDEATLRPRSGSGCTPTQIGTAIGTPAFMPPEQALGNLDQLGPRSDIYSLGATLYFLLTGRRPFESNSLDDVLIAVQRGDFPNPRVVNHSIPKPLEAICLKAMALNIDDRYAEPQDLTEDIERWLGDEPVTAFKEPWTIRAQRWARRHQTLAASITVLLFAGAVAFAVSALMISKAQQATVKALASEKLARIEADTQRQAADKQREIAESESLKNRRTSANLAYDRARGSSENGDLAVGINWYVRAMTLSPESDAPFRDLIHANLSHWKEELVKLKHQFHTTGGYADGAKVSSNGRILFIGRPGVGVNLWDTATGDNTQTLRFPELEADSSSQRESHGQMIPVAISTSGQLCAAGKGTEVYLWSVENGSANGNPITLVGVVTSLTFHPRDDSIAIGTASGNVHVYDMKTREQIRKFSANRSTINVLAFRPDGEVLLTGGYDGKIRLWNVDTGEQMQKEFSHRSVVTAARWSTDGNRILVGDFFGMVAWDVASATPVFRKNFSGAVVSIDISSDSERFAFGVEENKVEICDINSGESLRHVLRHEGDPRLVAFDSTGQRLITLTGNGIVRTWQIPDKVNSVRRLDGAHMNKVAIHPNSELIAVAHMKGILQVHNVATGMQVGPKLDFKEPVASIMFSPNGKHMFVGGFRGSCRVYATDGLEQVGPVMNARGAVLGVAFIDNDQVAIASMSGEIQIKNFRTGKSIGSEMKHDVVVSVAVSNGKLCSVGHDANVRLWSVQTQKEILPTIKGASQLSSAAMSPDGEYVAAGGGSVRLWSSESGKLLAQFAHPGNVGGLKFSSDNRLLLTNCNDEAVRLWHVSTGKAVGPIRRLVDQLIFATFDKNDRIVATFYAGDDPRVRVWDRPAELTGSGSALRLWAEVRTGLKLTKNGDINVLSPKEWAKANTELSSLPPLEGR